MEPHIEIPHGSASFDDEHGYTIRSSPFELTGGRPTIDGKDLPHLDASVRTSPGGGFEVTYSAGALTVRLTSRQAADRTLEIELAVTGFEPGASFAAFGLRFPTVTGADRALRQGFYSWDGTEIFDLGETMASLDPLETRLGFPAQASHSVTALLGHQTTMVIGVTETRRMPQTFEFTTDDSGDVSLEIAFRWEHASTEGLTMLTADPLRVIQHDDTEQALRTWARIFGDNMGGGRVAPDPMRGWCSWYYLYYFATEQDIEDNLAGAIAARDGAGIPLDVFLIDANHFAQLGDWLEPHPHFYPNGQERLVAMIKDAGFTPGLWIAPFWVTNRSKLAQDHPDWLVRTPADELLTSGTFYGEEKIWCYPCEEAYVLDTTHPGAQNYLRTVIDTWRKWGVEYFKTDFMFQGMIPGVRRDLSKNRMAVWRETAEMLRDAMGDAYWSGCGQPLFPSVGLVDANRVSGDVGPAWTGRLSQESTLRDTLNRHYMHNVFWQNDPDCVLIRDFHHELTDTEVESLGLYAGISGGLCLTSDPLHQISADRRSFFRFITPKKVSTPRAPLMGSGIRGLLCFVSDGADNSHVALFLNSSEQPVAASLSLAELGLAERLHALDWSADAELGPVVDLSIGLAPHASRLVYFAAGPFDGWRPEHLLDSPV